MTLPPGQHAVEGFPRFGTHLHQPPPAVPGEPVIEIAGAVAEPVAVRVADLATLPRRDLTADFHCVAGWSAIGLRWEGVAFSTVYAELVEPSPAVSHVVFEGLDGFRSSLLLEDALAGDVLIADRLDGQPLGPDHGAPARLVSPRQYGFMSTKHLCRIELHTSAPPPRYGATSLSRVGLRALGFKFHPRSRVWHEERHRHLPGWSLRHLYRAVAPGIRVLSARGGGR